MKDARGRTENLDSKSLQGLVARAMDNIQEQLKRIFGSGDATENAEMLAELGFPVTVKTDVEDENLNKYKLKREDHSIYEDPGV